MDEVEELGDGCLRGYVLLYKLLPFVEADLSGSGSYITKIGIRHLSRTIDDAPHHSYLQPFQIPGGFLDFLKGLLEVEQSPSASRARDIFRFADA